jgi:hypothetical protein
LYHANTDVVDTWKCKLTAEYKILTNIPKNDGECLPEEKQISTTNSKETKQLKNQKMCRKYATD